VSPLIRYLKYGLVLLVILAAAILTGKFIHLKHHEENPAEIVTADTPDEATPDIENYDYVASLPTFGPLIRTQPIQVEYQIDQALATLPNDQAEEIEIGQPVILFDNEEYILPLGGAVNNIEENDQETTITVKLPEGTHIEYLSPHMEVITMETMAAKRVPMSALQKSKTDQDYVWIVDESEDGTPKATLKRAYVDVGLKNEDFFIEGGDDIESFTYVVLNPDDNIEPDKEYSILKTEISGPLHNPIRQAWIDYELFRLDAQQAELTQIAEDCRNGRKSLVLSPGALTLEDGTQTGSGCGQTTVSPALQQFQIFNSLVNGGGDSSNCASSAACGQ